jgi:hypothetical protein
VDAHDRQTDIDLQILDLLRQEEEGPKSAYRLASELPRRPGEQALLGTHAVRKRLEALASRGLVAGSASAHAAAAGQAEAPALADPWKITEEGLAVVEPEAGVASAPTTARSWARRRRAVVATRASGCSALSRW